MKDLKDWLFSSYPFYAGSVLISLVNKNLAVQFCGYNSIDFPEKTKKGSGKNNWIIEKGK